MEGIHEDSINQVSQVFPDVNKNVIRNDLSFTHSVEQTINRILDGTILQSNSVGSVTCSSTDVNSDSELDLPIIQPYVTPLRLQSIVTLKNKSEQFVDLVSKDDQADNLSDTDVNSDSDLPDIDVPSDNAPIDLTEDELEEDLQAIIAFAGNKDVAANNVDIASCSNLLDEVDGYSRKVSTTGTSRTEKMFSDSSDSENDCGLANRLGLAERCGFGMKGGSLSKFSSVATGSSEVSLPDEDSNSSEVPRLKGVKRKSKEEDVQIGDQGEKKMKRKRNAEEIAEKKRQAEEKKAERQRLQAEKKAQKQRETEMRKAVMENKRHFRAGNCVQYMTVSVDPGVINNGQLGAGIFKVCGELGARCVTENQLVPNTITWKREVLDCQQASAVKQDVLEDDVLAMIPLGDFVAMVQNYVHGQQGMRAPDAITVREFIHTLQGVYTGKTISVFVVGKDKYFSNQKLGDKRRHREAVMNVGGGQAAKQKSNKKGGLDISVTRVQMEEALIDAQLHTNCVVQFAETCEDAADLVKCFTKAVADKPAKKDRLENVFDFITEGAAGVKVDKTGNGLLKVWKHQLLQFKHVGPDMADAIVATYPSPRMLHMAYQRCTTEKEAQKLLENINVRRGAGVLATNRRIGKELSRKVYHLLNSKDCDFIIK